MALLMVAMPSQAQSHKDIESLQNNFIEDSIRNKTNNDSLSRLQEKNEQNTSTKFIPCFIADDDDYFYETGIGKGYSLESAMREAQRNAIQNMFVRTKIEIRGVVDKVCFEYLIDDAGLYTAFIAIRVSKSLVKKD